MARPKTPLVSKRTTLEAGLRIVDGEGLEALTIRRLAGEIGVNGASLYHHFSNKDEILAGVAALALEKVRTPVNGNQGWESWVLANAVDFRRALLAHPTLAPVLLRRHPLRIGLKEHNATASLLAVQGIPAGFVLPLLESLESMALGDVLYSSAIDAAKNPSDEGDDWGTEFPHLHSLAAQASIDHDEAFELAARGVISAFAERIENS